MLNVLPNWNALSSGQVWKPCALAPRIPLPRLCNISLKHDADAAEDKFHYASQAVPFQLYNSGRGSPGIVLVAWTRFSSRVALIFCLGSSVCLLPLFAVAQTNTNSALEEIPPLRPPRAEIPPGFWEQHSGEVLAVLL